MFETSTVRAGALQARGRFSLLTVSLVAHSAVIIGAIAVSIASTNFPNVAPDAFATFLPTPVVSIPPRLGDPNGGAQPKPEQPKPQTPPPQQPNHITAPPAVPDEVPQVAAPGSGDDTSTGLSTGTVSGPIGQPWGDPNSIGDLDAPPAVNNITPPVENKIYTTSEVKAPVLIHRVEPAYPSALIRAKLPGKVAMRCVIDRNGRIRDAQLIYATNAAFEASVRRAIAEWRYTPASLHGQAVECYLDLNVSFGVR